MPDMEFRETTELAFTQIPKEGKENVLRYMFEILMEKERRKRKTRPVRGGERKAG